MDELLYQANKYMFFNFEKENLNTLVQNKTPQINKPQAEKGIFYINKKDKLFWCYFILRYGLESYNLIDKHFFKIEKKEKEKCIHFLEENKSKIKQRKLKFNTNDLLYDSCISLEMFFSLCCAANINVVLIQKNTFFKLIDNSERDIKYIYKDDKLGYGIKQNKIGDLSKTHLESVSLTKHIKGLSAYRIAEIQKMCDILKINTRTVHGKPITKIELYNKIIKCIN